MIFPNKLLGFLKKVFIFVIQLRIMATQIKPVLSIKEQIIKSLDGRPQRWLIKKIDMKEDTFNKKINGFLQFTDEEMEAINNCLSTNIQKQ